MHRLSTLVLGLIFFGAGSIEQGLAGKLRASCVKVDITPGKPVLMQAYPRPGPSEGCWIGSTIGSLPWTTAIPRSF